MGKKIPITISILTLLSGALWFKAPLASAAVTKDGVTYWTVAEMLEFKETVDAEIAAKCLGDFECEDDTRYEYYSRGGQYQALEMADQIGGFMVTNVNPGRETITLRYTNFEDRWMRRMGIEQEVFDPTALYMLWVEDGKNDPFINTQYMYDYVEQIKSDSVEDGVHVVLVRENERDGTNWLPRGEEVEFSIPGSDLTSINSDGKIAHKLDGPDGIVLSIGHTFLSECLNSPDYEVGMDCRFMLGDNGSAAYIPLVVTEDTATKQIIDENNDSSRGGGLVEIIASSNDATNTTASVQESSIIAKTPNTGGPSAALEQNTEFPWWLGVIFCLGLSTFAWFFWPKRQNHPKSQKKLSKSLDKFKEVR